MATAKATLIGMYNFDSSIFDKMVLPDGIDKELFINTLLLKSGEFELLYFDPVFLQNSIGVWSNKWYRTFAEWLRGTQASWNPIHNYDRTESITDSGSKSFGSKKTADYSDTRTADLQEQRTANLQEQRTADLQDQTTFANADTTEQTVDGTTTHKVSAYDSSGYQNSSQDLINNGTSSVSHSGTVTNATTGTDTNATTGTDTTATTGTDTMIHSGTLSDETGSESHSDTHSAHVYGNIGVTQASDMLRSFYDISAWNLYDHMADVFTQELLIPVY